MISEPIPTITREEDLQRHSALPGIAANVDATNNYGDGRQPGKVKKEVGGRIKLYNKTGLASLILLWFKKQLCKHKKIPMKDRLMAQIFVQ